MKIGKLGKNVLVTGKNWQGLRRPIGEGPSKQNISRKLVWNRVSARKQVTFRSPPFSYQFFCFVFPAASTSMPSSLSVSLPFPHFYPAGAATITAPRVDPGDVSPSVKEKNKTRGSGQASKRVAMASSANAANAANGLQPQQGQQVAASTAAQGQQGAKKVRNKEVLLKT